MKIVFATGNKGKLKEAREIFKDHEVISIKDIVCDFDPEETGDTFLQNAVIKAEAAFEFTNEDAVLSDDSGLVVPALNGDPGVYSSRYGGEDGNDALNRKKLLEEMKDISDRSAYFQCTAVLLKSDGSAIVKTGKCCGSIGFEEKGTSGFGYDPIFIPQGLEKTMAELTPDEKNALSHRGIAFRKIMENSQ
jgi:XTP/dITP diphosphohydrolase